MVPKPQDIQTTIHTCFRAVLFRMVPKRILFLMRRTAGFRAVLFRMVPKRNPVKITPDECFRAVLFRMVPKP